MKATVTFDNAGTMNAEGDEEAVLKLYKMYMAENADKHAADLKAVRDSFLDYIFAEEIDDPAIRQQELAAARLHVQPALARLTEIIGD